MTNKLDYLANHERYKDMIRYAQHQSLANDIRHDKPKLSWITGIFNTLHWS